MKTTGKDFKKTDEKNNFKTKIERMEFVLINCQSYLELYKDQWLEGEEILYSEITRALNDNE